MPDPPIPSAPEAGDAEPSPMSAQEALHRMAGVTELTRGLRTRTEGITFIVWGICMAASYLTLTVPLLGFGGPGGPPRGGPGGGLMLLRLMPLLWFIIAGVVTVGLWRSAALNMSTGVTTPRIVAFLASWLLLFIAATIAFTWIEGGRPQSWHIAAWSFVLGLFAIMNPLRFTMPSRVGAGLAAVVALAAAGYGYINGIRGFEASLLAGAGVGGPLLLVGVYLLYRG